MVRGEGGNSEKTNSGKVEEGRADEGERAKGERAKGERAGGERAKGERAEGERAEGERAEGERDEERVEVEFETTKAKSKTSRLHMSHSLPSDDILTDVVVFGQIEQLPDLSGSLRTETTRDGGISQA